MIGFFKKTVQIYALFFTLSPVEPQKRQILVLFCIFLLINLQESIKITTFAGK